MKAVYYSRYNFFFDDDRNKLNRKEKWKASKRIHSTYFLTSRTNVCASKFHKFIDIAARFNLLSYKTFGFEIEDLWMKDLDEKIFDDISENTE